MQDMRTLFEGLWRGPMPWEVAGTTHSLPQLTDGLMRIAGVETFDTDVTATGFIPYRRPTLAELKRIPTPLTDREQFWIRIENMALLKKILEPMILQRLRRETSSHMRYSLQEQLANAMMRFPMFSDGTFTEEGERRAFIEITKYFPHAAAYTEWMNDASDNWHLYWGNRPQSDEAHAEWRNEAKQLGAALYGDQWIALHRA